jgi:hypothetical protein
MSGNEVRGVVNVCGDLQPYAEGFDVGEHHRDGDRVTLSAFNVADPWS